MADLLDLTLPLPVDRIDCVDEEGMAAPVGGATAPDVMWRGRMPKDADVVLLIV